KHHTTIAEVESANSMEKGENLKVGRSLKVPVDTYFPERKSESTKVASSKKTPQKSTKIADYKVQSGDTLFIIARKHHTTIAEVESANSMEKGENLKVGRSLKVPVDTYFPERKSESTKVASSKKTSPYTVKSGDTLSEIAELHSVTVAQLKKANNLKSEKLKLGQVIVMKGSPKSSKKIAKAKTKKKSTSYTVKSGDTLYEIALKHNTTVDKLKKANNLKSEKLKLGQVIAMKGSPKSSKKVAKAKTKPRKRVASSKKSSPRKLVLEAGSKKSLFSKWSRGGSSLKLGDAKKHLGKRYVWGAAGPSTFDCSGFTSYICKKSGVSVPRTSIKQSKVGKRVKRKNLKAGDLVFFDTSKRHRGYVNHVGIYIGNNKFIHASSAKKRVVITSLNKPFYKSRFKWGSRVKG
ncbi:MAG: LysM peptidoglycan-binding domain-containing protein, partial [Campylobacterota bacterium]|nr:LysM peptidoglycan-binding domain-containing protein [Campylobacterota bacterium]